MIQYKLYQKYPHHQFLQVEMNLHSEQEAIHLKLPDWRPGRYQLGNFSKFIRSFRVVDSSGKKANCNKINKNTWRIIGQKNTDYTISYEVYTSQIDGGSTYVDENQWYLNFINCMIYVEEKLDTKVSLELCIPNDWQIACGLPKDENELRANSFYELYDSPAICSGQLKKLSYTSHEKTFHLWFMGEVKLGNTKKIINDFKRFTDLQIETMGSFDDENYHFLFQILPQRAYHGVEHLNSTCIVLGPASSFGEEEFYDNFLGISSHELFHYWNIIRIRPKEMYPYNFDRENYFTTGYVAEGVTTYYGDLFLVRSGVKSLEWYLSELNKLLKRHLENYGREFYSVAESSFDLWLDGYEAGVPNRKVSIYVKGALIALLLDLKIIKQSNGKYSLDEVMKHLWSSNYKRFKGYSEEEYMEAANALLKEDINDYKENYIYGKTPVEEELHELLKNVGFQLVRKNHDVDFTAFFGCKISNNTVTAIAPESPADASFRIDDEILAINKSEVSSFDHFEIKALEEYIITIKRNAFIKNISLRAPKKANYYYTYEVRETKEENNETKTLRKKWLNL